MCVCIYIYIYICIHIEATQGLRLERLLAPLLDDDHVVVLLGHLTCIYSYCIHVYIYCMYMFTLLDLCVSSLRRGHANLLCIVPILTDDPRRESILYVHVVCTCCMYACMYVCMYVYIYTYIYAYIICMHLYVYIDLSLSLYIYIYQYNILCYNTMHKWD